MILVPFEALNIVPQMFEPALDLAEETSATLVLLCVRPPGKSLWYAHEDERLFADLKGLQAQMHKRAIPVRIETVVGPVAKFILDYADKYKVDMIMIPETSKVNGWRAVNHIFGNN